VCAFDLTQVFILNMTYDIRLKSVSSQLLLLSLFLLAPYARRLFVVLFTDRAIPATESVPLFTSRRANRMALIAQVCVGVVLLAPFGGQGWQQFTRPTPNLYGIWQVDGFSAEVTGAIRCSPTNSRTDLGSFEEAPTRIRLTYWWPDPNPGTDRIVIDGEDFAGHRIHAWFTQMDPNSFPLVERALQLGTGAAVQPLMPPTRT
jgi:hypothetical protein